MSRRESSSSKTLEVKSMFEPSRIAPLCLAQAYEHLIPIVRRTANPVRDTGSNIAKQQRRQVGA